MCGVLGMESPVLGVLQDCSLLGKLLTITCAAASTAVRSISAGDEPAASSVVYDWPARALAECHAPMPAAGFATPLELLHQLIPCGCCSNLRLLH